MKIAKSQKAVVLTLRRKVIDDDMNGLEKSMTDSLEAVMVRSAAIQSISSRNNIPTRP